MSLTDWRRPTAVAGDRPPPSGAAGRGLMQVGWALFAATFLLEGVAVLRASHWWLIHRLPDDAFYYLEIAQRMARGEGSTFDGMHATNGYHPLWQMVLAGLAVLFGGDALIRAALLAGLAAGGAALLVVRSLLARVVGPGLALAAVVVAAHPLNTVFVLSDGMEGAVTVLSLALLALALSHALRTGSGNRADVLAGVAVGLVVLARIDFAAVAVAVPIALAWRARRLRPAALAMLGAAAVVAPWAAFNRVTFGHVLPVSGYLKLQQLPEQFEARFGGRLSLGYVRFVLDVAADYLWSLLRPASFSGYTVTGVVLVGLALVGGVAAVRSSGVARRGGGALPAPTFALLTVASMATAKALMDVVTLPYWARAWYSAPARVTFGVAVGLGACAVVAAALRGRRPLAGVGLAVIVGAMLPTTGGDLRSSSSAEVAIGSWQDANVLAARWIDEYGEDAVYGSTDAGVLGFDIDPVPVVNLDGLVNSYSYADALLAGRPPLERYRSQQVRFLVIRGVPGDTRVPACVTTRWRSPWPVGYGGGADNPVVSYIPLGIYDLASCP